MKLSVPILGQRDSRWTNLLLGFNNSLPYTIGGYGCLITCLSMMIGKTPDQVNEILKQNQGFVSGSGEFIWGTSKSLGLTQTYASSKYSGPVTDLGVSKAQEYLTNGFPLLCEVDFNPIDTQEQMHFVLATGFDGENFYCNDPWTGDDTTFDKYGGFRRAVIQFRAYDKKFLPETSAPKMVSLDSTKFEELVTKSTIFDELVKLFNWPFNKDLILQDAKKFVSYEEIIKEKDRQIEELKGKIVILEEKAQELEGKNKALVTRATDMADTAVKNETLVHEQADQIKRLQGAIQGLKNDIAGSVTSLSPLEMIVRGFVRLFVK